VSEHVRLTETQMQGLQPLFPKRGGKPWLNHRLAPSGEISIGKHGSQWKDAPCVYGPPKTPCPRFVLWSRMRQDAKPPVKPRLDFIGLIAPSNHYDDLFELRQRPTGLWCCQLRMKLEEQLARFGGLTKVRESIAPEQRKIPARDTGQPFVGL
jgi:transposase